MNKEYYVYAVYGLHGELLYIGYGKGDRYKHCNSGMSSNKGLNRYYFNHGEGDCIRVEIIYEYLSKKEASGIEMNLIKQLKPICNIVGANYIKIPLGLPKDECIAEIKKLIWQHENIIKYYTSNSIPYCAVEYGIYDSKYLVKDGDTIKINPEVYDIVDSLESQ